MMKKILLTLLAFMATIATNAEQVSKQQALQKAQQFMPNKHFGEVKAFARGDKSASLAEYEAFYIFNAEGKKGFVIVSGDNRTEPILGYSDRGSLNVDSVPDNVKGLLNYYEKVLTAIANDKSYTRPAKTRSGEERTKVETLMATEWGQDFPYNIKCPIFNGQRSVTGCVATALAQVLNYNRWPKDYTSAVPAYTTWSNQIYMPQLEPIKFGWGAESLQFLGNLMLYCGQAVEMNYGVDESGADTSIIPELLKNIFAYPDGAQFVIKDEYTEEEWDNLMYAEMAGGRPVIYSGFGEQMTGYGGHAFVIDGYDSGRYHVNWGWDGQSNGFFMLTGLNVTGASYNDYQDAVIGIQSPEGTAGTVKPKAQVYSVVYNDEKKYFWRRDDGTFPKFNMFANVYSTTGEKEKLQLGWGLFNEKGLVTVYAQEQQEIGSDESECYGYFASIVIDDKIDDGDYCLLPVCRSTDSEEWLADVANLYGSGLRPDYYTEIRISNNLMKLIYDDTSKSFDRGNHGYLIKDGIAFDLWQDLDEKHYATVITPQSGHYSGDIVIPDVISHNSKDYKVYDADLTTFENCQELTSLSISMIQGPRIWNCPKLKTIEFREGTTDYPDKNRIFLCDKLKTIKFNTINQLLFQGCPFEDYLPALTDVYFMSIYPPSQPPFYGEDNFSVKENVTLHIPKGAMPDYQKSGWKSWNLSDDLVVENKAVKWGYVNDNNTGHYNSPEIGSLERCDVDLAIHVPAEMIGKYKDQKITGIEFFCINMLNSNFPDYVFITKPGTDYLVKQSVTVSRTTGWKSIILSEPYIITGDELYVGIGRYYVHDFGISSFEPHDYDGQWCRIMGGDKTWENRYNEETGHPLTLRFIIEGENLPKDLRLCQPKMVNEDSTNKIQVSVVNRCADLLTSYAIKWNFDGKVNGTKTIETCLASCLAETLEIDVPTELEGYHHTLTLDVVSVNGIEDAIPANSHLVYEFTSSANHYPRKMVLEDFVGTWCGWSPRGYVATEKMHEKYPNNFIPIEIHENSCYGAADAVGEPYNYGKYITEYSSTPTFLINRLKTIDSTLDEAAKAYEEQKDHADAIIQSNVVFVPEDNTSVTVKTSTTFGFTDEGHTDFRIAYVVVEDNVGPYSQANFYSDSSMPDNPDDYMNEWYKKGSPIEMKFNDVARGIYPDLKGMEGSVPTSVVAGQPYEYEYTFELPDNIQDKKNICIVTLLIDNKSGEIMNADQTKVITETDMNGDANNDNVVDNKDVDAVIRYIMYGDIKGFNFKNADVNKDDKVDVTDIVLIVNMIK